MELRLAGEVGVGIGVDAGRDAVVVGILSLCCECLVWVCCEKRSNSLCDLIELIK